MSKIIVSGSLVLALLATASTGQAGPRMFARCAEDSLSPPEAQARLQWMRRCALKGKEPTNDRAPSRIIPGLLDYEEFNPDIKTDTANAYTSLDESMFSINYTFAYNYYRFSSAIVQSEENGYIKWTTNTPRAQPMYPMYGDNASMADAKIIVPNPNDPSDCSLYYRSATAPYTYTALPKGTSFHQLAFCESSCYAPEQRVLFDDGEHPIATAVAERKPYLQSLSPDSTLSSWSLQRAVVGAYTQELRDSTHPIVSLQTASGGSLRVTPEHPILNGAGEMVEARSLRVGDEVLSVEGGRDVVTSVLDTTHVGKVYNVRPATSNRVANVIVAQGLLVGSSAYQNEYLNLMNRMLLRHGVPADKLPR